VPLAYQRLSNPDRERGRKNEWCVRVRVCVTRAGRRSSRRDAAWLLFLVASESESAGGQKRGKFAGDIFPRFCSCQSNVDAASLSLLPSLYPAATSCSSHSLQLACCPSSIHIHRHHSNSCGVGSVHISSFRRQVLFDAWCSISCRCMDNFIRFTELAVHAAFSLYQYLTIQPDASHVFGHRRKVLNQPTNQRTNERYSHSHPNSRSFAGVARARTVDAPPKRTDLVCFAQAIAPSTHS